MQNHMLILKRTMLQSEIKKMNCAYICVHLFTSIFQCMFAVNSATHDYGTRQKDHYKVPKVKLEVVKNSVRYRGVIIWNMILQNIDIATSLQSFKFHLRQGILRTLITSVSNEM